MTCKMNLNIIESAIKKTFEDNKCVMFYDLYCMFSE